MYCTPFVYCLRIIGSMLLLIPDKLKSKLFSHVNNSFLFDTTTMLHPFTLKTRHMKKMSSRIIYTNITTRLSRTYPASEHTPLGVLYIARTRSALLPMAHARICPFSFRKSAHNPQYKFTKMHMCYLRTNRHAAITVWI